MEDSLGNPWLLETIALAQEADPHQVRPNPRVGALLLDAHNNVVGRGYHPALGQPHAEVFAIQEALKNGARLDQCRLFVSLEPCSHVGRTPACCSLILHHRIPEVWVASIDPNPKVNGLELLQKNGVIVHYSPMTEAIEINKAFWVNQVHKRPYIKLKMAESSNGYVTAQLGTGTPISGRESRTHSHQELREGVDAILTTAKTVMIDNPWLNVRLEDETKELSVVVIDRTGSLLHRPDLNLFYPRKHSRIYLVCDQDHNTPEHSKDVEIIPLAFSDGRAPLKELFHAIYARFELAALLVESGPELAESMLNQQLIDEVHLYQAPQSISPSTGLLNFSKKHLESAICISTEKIGNDSYQCFDFQHFKQD
ncbi:MAG: riboflavin biosynthesis protein RibD [Bacteroidota bacterium]|jgi:diaminohydroxyphosphoribosylaminopyrimidine deaminase/5-amino-6-(5-phosphoribosylamino)uracil reductase